MQDLSTIAFLDGVIPGQWEWGEKEPHGPLESAAKLEFKTQQVARSLNIDLAGRMWDILWDTSDKAHEEGTMGIIIVL